MDRIRLAIGRKLLRWALEILPEHSIEKQALARELTEQRVYDRYEGYTILMGGSVMPFERWRREWDGMTRLRKVTPMPQRQFPSFSALHRA